MEFCFLQNISWKMEVIRYIIEFLLWYLTWTSVEDPQIWQKIKILVFFLVLLQIFNPSHVKIKHVEKTFVFNFQLTVNCSLLGHLFTSWNYITSKRRMNSQVCQVFYRFATVVSIFSSFLGKWWLLNFWPSSFWCCYSLNHTLFHYALWR